MLLHSVFLQYNSLIGILPSEIGILIGLKILNLAQNHLSGEISDELPIGLNYLDLSSNAFSDVIPRSVVNLTQLQLINLSYNQFSGEIPVSFGDLQQLQYLKIFWFLIIYFFIFVVFQWFLTKIT